jgi:serine protease SohB
LDLVDELGDLRSALRARFGDKVKMRLITAQRGLFGRRVPGVSTGRWPWIRLPELAKQG